MQFGRIDAHFKACEEHLDKHGLRNTEYEYYLVQYLLVRICAEYEDRVKVMFERRCSRIGDKEVKKFLQRNLKDYLKHFDIKDIANVMARFGEEYRTNFQNSLSQPANTGWNNVYVNRQQAAHQGGVQMTLTDLKKDYASSLLVFDAIASVFKLTASEMKGLG